MKAEQPGVIDLLIEEADYIVTCDDDHQIIKNGALAIRDGLIVDIGHQEEIKSKYVARQELNLSHHIVMPGLVNTHVHAPMILFRGLGDDLPLSEWLNSVIFPAELQWISPESVYASTLLAAAEMLLGGTTTFSDGYFFEEQVARAAMDLGIRAVVGQGVLDFPTPDCSNPNDRFRRVEKFLSKVSQRATIIPSLFCHSTYTCSSETIRRVHEICLHNALSFQIHLAETLDEVQVIRDRYTLAPGRFLDSLGIMDEGCICIHGVWLDDEELRIIKDRGTRLVHCVESNLKLASGIARLPTWQKMGIIFGIGTDGAASNNNLDMFSEMTMVAHVHKGVNEDPTVCKANAVLHAATLQGARVLGLESVVGSIEKGKAADIIALTLDRPHLIPIYDPISHIVYAAKSSDVRHVWVDGRQVVNNRTLLSADLQDIMHDVRLLAPKIYNR